MFGAGIHSLSNLLSSCSVFLCVNEHGRRKEEVGSCGRKIQSLLTDIRGGWLTEVKLLGKGCEAAPFLPSRSVCLQPPLIQPRSVNYWKCAPSLPLSFIEAICSVYFPWVTVEYGGECSEINSILSLVFLSLCVCSHASGPGHSEWQHKLHNCQRPGPHLPQRHHGEPSGENFIL